MSHETFKPTPTDGLQPLQSLPPLDTINQLSPLDMVNHPPHYERGPLIACPSCDHHFTLQHIEVFRAIKEPRLATAFKYIWRVAFGGKDSGNQAKDVQDIGKAGFYLKDYQDHPR